jgi:hypothetical protein
VCDDVAKQRISRIRPKLEHLLCVDMVNIIAGYLNGDVYCEHPGASVDFKGCYASYDYWISHDLRSLCRDCRGKVYDVIDDIDD